MRETIEIVEYARVNCQPAYWQEDKIDERTHAHGDELTIWEHDKEEIKKVKFRREQEQTENRRTKWQPRRKRSNQHKRGRSCETVCNQRVSRHTIAAHNTIITSILQTNKKLLEQREMMKNWEKRNMPLQRRPRRKKDGHEQNRAPNR